MTTYERGFEDGINGRESAADTLSSLTRIAYEDGYFDGEQERTNAEFDNSVHGTYEGRPYEEPAEADMAWDGVDWAWKNETDPIPYPARFADRHAEDTNQGPTNYSAGVDAEEAAWREGWTDGHEGARFQVGIVNEQYYAEGYLMGCGAYDPGIMTEADMIAASAEMDAERNGDAHNPLLDALVAAQAAKYEAQWARGCAASIPQDILAAKIYAEYMAQEAFAQEDLHAFGYYG